MHTVPFSVLGAAIQNCKWTHALGLFQGAAPCGGCTPRAKPWCSLDKSPISLIWHTKSNEQIHYLNQTCTKAQTLPVSHLLFLTLINPLKRWWHVNTKPFKAMTDTSHPLFSAPTSERVYVACQKKGKWNKAWLTHPCLFIGRKNKVVLFSAFSLWHLMIMEICMEAAVAGQGKQV